MIGLAGRALSLPPSALPSYTPPFILARSAIPFIGLSSGSVSAAGAISGITALPVAYANAYCWFPANALATVKPAGWYFCQFSSTTTGTAFLDSYTSGIPAIPAAPTAVTDGKGAFIGDTGEEFGPTITVPANALGPNGFLRVYLRVLNNNSAGTKTPRLRYSGNAGTILYSNALSTNTIQVWQVSIENLGVTGAQRTFPYDVTGTASQTVQLPATATASAIDTTASTSLVFSLQRNTAADNAIIESFLIELLYGA